MVFTLDEDIGELCISDSDCDETPQQLLQPMSAEDVGKHRRKSSVLEKLPVVAPLHSRRLSIPVGDGQGQEADPKILADFKPVRVLGKGAYGKVILVKDERSSKLYAMKQLQKAEIIIENDEPDNVSKRVERIFAEKTILSQLDHPNVVKLFYTFHDNSRLYLLLQYIPGGELFYHLKERGTLDEDTAAFYAAEISCALKFLHEKGIVYRDLKPENCLLDSSGHLVLTDFGLSKKSVDDNDSSSSEDVSELHSIIGTPEYCAPEILKGEPYTRNCDWYSLGCLVYDMLVGKPPYTGANHKVILNKIQQEKQGPRIPFYLSDGMKDWLGALLKKDCNKRWDVDRYWAAQPQQQQQQQQKRRRKKKAGQERTSPYTNHFVFRKINWQVMQDGVLQRSEQGPIVPIITNLELAENFDEEFTSLPFNESQQARDIPKADLFNGFSYKASGSYLEKYF